MTTAGDSAALARTIGAFEAFLGGKAAVEVVESAVEALVAEATRGGFEFEAFCEVWRLVTRAWDAVVRSCGDRAVLAARPEDGARTLRVACALSDLIPEEVQNDEVRLARLRVYVKAAETWLRLGVIEESGRLLNYASSKMQYLREQLRATAGLYWKEEVGHAFVEVAVLEIKMVTACEMQLVVSDLWQICAAVRDAVLDCGLSDDLVVDLCCRFVQAVLSEVSGLGTSISGPSQTQVLPLLEDVCAMLKAVSGSHLKEGKECLPVWRLYWKARGLRCLECLRQGNPIAAREELNELKRLREGMQDCEMPEDWMWFESLLSLHVLLQTGQADDAAADMLCLLSNRKSDVTVCLQALSAFLKQKPLPLETLKGVAAVLERKFPGDGAVLMRFTDLALERHDLGEAEEGYLLGLLSSLSASTNCPELRSDMFRILWNCGVRHFQTKSYRAASRAFELSYRYATEDRLVKVARALALCFIGNEDYCRAAEWISLCHSIPGQLIETVDCFIQFKLSLLKQDDEAAVEALQHLVQCPDFTADALRVACQEALANERHSVVQSALVKIQDVMKRQEMEGVTEALVLRLLIKHLLRGAFASMAAPGDGCGGWSECGGGIVSHFENVLERLDVIGREKFFDQSWNAAIHATKAALNSKPLSSKAIISSFHPEDSSQQRTRRKLAYLRGAAALLSDLDGEMGSSLDDALDMVKCAKAVGRTEDPEIEKLMLWVEVEIACRVKGSLTKTLERCRILKHCTGDDMLQIASLVKDKCCEEKEACYSQALQIALQKLLSEKPLQLDCIAAVRRSVIQNSADETDRLNWYKEALRMLSVYRCRIAEIPAHEIKWLVHSCWNHGCHAARFRRRPFAKEYLTVAIGLAEYNAETVDKKQKLLKDMNELLAAWD